MYTTASTLKHYSKPKLYDLKLYNTDHLNAELSNPGMKKKSEQHLVFGFFEAIYEGESRNNESAK